MSENKKKDKQPEEEKPKEKTFFLRELKYIDREDEEEDIESDDSPQK